MKPIEPGCLAIFVNTGTKHDGEQVSVLCRVSQGARFTLPDGVPAVSASGGWVVALPAPIEAALESGESRLASYGSVAKRFLMRIDGHEEPTTTEKAVEA